MLGHISHTSSRKHIVAAIILGSALLTPLCQFVLSATHGCQLLDGNAWVLIMVLRPIFLAACHSIHLAENSICSASMPQIASSAGSLLCVFAGLA